MTLSFLILNVFNTFAMAYAVSKFLETKIDYKSKKFYIALLIISIYSFCAYYITKSVLRIIILFELCNVCFIYMFKSDKNTIQKITLASLIGFVLCLLCEIVVDIAAYIVLTTLFEAETVNYFTNFLGYLVVIVFLAVANIKKLNTTCVKAINKFQFLKTGNIIMLSMGMFIILTTTLYLIYFDLNQLLKFALLILTFTEFLCLIMMIAINHKNKEKLQKELDLMIEITTKYEKIISNTRTTNHENKNQLIVIKDLIGKDNKKAKSYIDSMIKTKYSDDDKLALKVIKVPSGGLKGLIYYKLLTMKSKKIECEIIVSNEIKKDILNKLNSKLLQNFYKVIGVFIDNSIEAVESLKHKTILIELYKEEKYLYFSISNEFGNKIDIEKLGSAKFSTKGENRGYGLQLVNALVSSSKDLVHESKLSQNVFTQKIGIKIEK